MATLGKPSVMDINDVPDTLTHSVSQSYATAVSKASQSDDNHGNGLGWLVGLE